MFTAVARGTELILSLSQESSSERNGIKTLLRPTARDLLKSLQQARGSRRHF